MAASSGNEVCILNYSRSRSVGFGLVPAHVLQPCLPAVILSSHLHYLDVSCYGSTRVAGMKGRGLKVQEIFYFLNSLSTL